MLVKVIDMAAETIIRRGIEGDEVLGFVRRGK
jgi:hypothetical protein